MLPYKNVKHSYVNSKDDVLVQQPNLKYDFARFSSHCHSSCFQAAARKERTHASLKAKRLTGVNMIKKSKTQASAGSTKTTTVTTTTKTSVASKKS